VITDLYQPIVLFNPSSKPVLALKLNSLFALDVSNILLGCPSGFEASQITFPLKPVSLTIR
jgi:hypothetical protein